MVIKFKNEDSGFKINWCDMGQEIMTVQDAVNAFCYTTCKSYGCCGRGCVEFDAFIDYIKTFVVEKS